MTAEDVGFVVEEDKAVVLTAEDVGFVVEEDVSSSVFRLALLLSVKYIILPGFTSISTVILF